MKLTDLIKYDKYGFFFITSNNETRHISDVANTEECDVELTDAGWQGRDIDNFDVWVINGSGEGFSIKGTFYNENDYNSFVKEFIEKS